MANNNRFALGGFTWELTADGTTIGNNPGQPLKDDWESLSVLEAEINALDDAGGGTLDLNYRQFAPQAGPNGDVREWANGENGIQIDIANDVTLFNGMISGAAILENGSWTDDGGGIYSAGYDLANVPNAITSQAYLIDPMATDVPLLATWPTAHGTERELVPRNNGPHWFAIRNGSAQVNDVLTWDATNGDTVNVVSGSSSKVRGLVINDLALRAQWDAEFTAILANDGVAISDVMLIAHTGFNEVMEFRAQSWDNSTGTLMLTSDLSGATTAYNNFYPGYFECAFIGAPSWITAAGQYTPDYTNNKVHYRPVDTLSPRGVGLQAVAKLLRILGGGTGTLTLNRLTLTGSDLIQSDSALGATGKITNAAHCNLHSFKTGLGSCNNINDCTFNYWYKTGAYANTAGFDEVFFERNRFGPNCEQRSCITVYGPDWYDENDPPETMGHFYARDNYLSIPWSTHGQGMSVYKDAWLKCTVEHNIFHNCARAFSYQHQNGSFGYQGNTGEFRFQNNLIVITDYFTPPGGQAGYSQNAAADYFLVDEEPLQSVKILSNSFLLPQDVHDIGEIRGPLGMNVEKHRLGPYLANNVCDGIDVAYDGRYGDMLAYHQHANNLQINPNGRFPEAWASTDLPDLADGDVFTHLASTDSSSPNSLAMGGIYATAATDGGPIGIRWDSIPSVDELRNGLSATWYLDHPASSVPDPPVNAYADAVKGLDNRTP